MATGTLSSRPWASREDTRLMQGLVSARLAADWPAVRFHPGDLDWWALLADPRFPPLTERVRLWFDDTDALLGYGWFTPPGDLDFLVSAAGSDTATNDLIRDIIDWGNARRIAANAAAVEPLRLWVAAEDTAAMGAAIDLGFVPEGRPGYVIFTGDLNIADHWPTPNLPDGLALRQLETDAHIQARVACGRAAFPSSIMTADRYLGVRDGSLYRPDLDLQIATPDGQVVAFALGWLDPTIAMVELEPVGVHPDWHRRGLGGEICRAVLRTARGLGARRAMISAERSNPAALALYTSLGLEITSEIAALVRPTMVAMTEAT